jgi:uncharacterized SAM-binding protein YcdF (DUF218 family)
VNGLVSLFGIESWKPLIAALILPPVPLLLLVLIGTRLVLSRRGLGWLLVLLATTGIWLAACTGTGALLARTLWKPPPALTSSEVAQLRAEAKAHQGITAIVVLGGGRDALAPEYGSSDLKPRSLERLRYGVWLAGETGLPVAFSGGSGWGAATGPAEAEVAERVAARDFGVRLKWIETESRDTHQNALRTVALLRQSGVTRLVIVTHGWHMRRALGDFEGAAAGQMTIVPAPMGLAAQAHGRVIDWIPSPQGYADVHHVLREALARLGGGP